MKADSWPDANEAHLELGQDFAARGDQLRVLKAMAGIYFSMHLVDLVRDTVTEFSAGSVLKPFYDPASGATATMRRTMTAVIAPEYQKEVLEFTDLTTLAERMQGLKNYSSEFIGIHIGWFIANFITIDTDAEERPTRVLFTTQSIDEQKKKEETLFIRPMARMECIIGGLVSEYADVIAVNLHTDEMMVYKQSERLRNLLGGNLDRSYFSLAAVSYVTNAVQKDFKAEMRTALLPETIRHLLEGVNSYSKVYKNDQGKYTEMKVVRTSDDTVIIGFAVKDAEIRRDRQRTLELEQAKKAAERASAAKSAFLFNMSHDIRTPMNAVLGLTHLAKRHILEPENLKTYLDQISVAGEQLLGIINNVLEISRIESEKVLISEELEDISALLTGVRTVCANQIRAGHLHISLNQALKHRYLYMDRTHLEEILTNLISNAIKYTPDGGNININITELAGDDPEHIKVCFEVRDSGIGMSKEFQERLFNNFERESSTTVSGIHGTGLGLAIVKKLVDLMHGTITVESEKNVGTAIAVTLPHRIGEAPVGAVVQEACPEQFFAGKRVLLAEDNDINALIAEELLTSKGLNVVRVADGLECLRMLKDGEAGYYDLVLMDIQMPKMDGYQATREIRGLEDVRKANIPILAMTANAFKEDQLKALEAGMNGHLSKPIDIDQLYTAINKILSVKS